MHVYMQAIQALDLLCVQELTGHATAAIGDRRPCTLEVILCHEAIEDVSRQ